MLVQALGVGDRVDVAVGSAEVLAGDVYMICTDGISGAVAGGVLHHELEANATLAERGDRLLRLAAASSGRDNASLILVEVFSP